MGWQKKTFVQTIFIETFQVQKIKIKNEVGWIKKNLELKAETEAFVNAAHEETSRLIYIAITQVEKWNPDYEDWVESGMNLLTTDYVNAAKNLNEIVEMP